MISVRVCTACKARFEFEIPDWIPNLRGPEICERCDAIKRRKWLLEELTMVRDLRLQWSMIPARFRQHDPARDPLHLADWAEGMRNRNVFLSGQNGTGKTHNLSHAAYRLVRDGVPGVLWLFCPDFLGDVCAALGDNAKRARGLVSEATAAALLLLDDLGKERETERSGEVLFCLLDARLRNGRPTWITTNLSGSEIEAKYGPDRGPAIRSRLLREDFATFAWGGGA